jgi:pilus assembly protein CpaC
LDRQLICCRHRINWRAFSGWLGVFLLMLSVVVWSSIARAQSSGELEVHVGEGRMIRLGEDAANVMVANSGIADVQTVTNGLFYLYGRRPGATTLTATNAKNGVAAQLRIRVTRSGRDAEAALPADASSVSVQFMNNRLVLGGSVAGLGAAVDANAAAQAFACKVARRSTKPNLPGRSK